MLTINEFEALLRKPESSTLDFKASMYEFTDDPDSRKIGKFIKGVISFCNTIRNETSFIIVGVSEENGTKNLLGSVHHVDDAILQDKVKDKVFPRPVFSYYPFNYDGQSFGVFEFPVTKYTTPLHSTAKLKGLETGRIYCRRGSTNSEAVGNEIIAIHNWIQSLPDSIDSNQEEEQLTMLTKRLTSGEEKLSTIIIDTLSFSRRSNYQTITKFCTKEIKGISDDLIENNPDEYKYRIQPIKISLAGIKINTSSLYAKGALIKSEMDSNENFFDSEMRFTDSILSIESTIEKFSETTICMTVDLDSTQIFPDEKKNYKLRGYMFKDCYEKLYSNIRKKILTLLVDAQ